MGFRISWLGFPRVPKVQVLALVGLVDTGQPDQANESSFSCAELPTGWTILWSNDFDFAAPEHVMALREGRGVLSCQIHAGIMYSAARWHRAAREVWEVTHDSSDGLYDLQVIGAAPPQLAAIRDRLTAEQNREDVTPPTMMKVDHIFDVPVALAEALCGFRHDRTRFDWGQPDFRAARRP
jgi:hypothetical protein